MRLITLELSEVTGLKVKRMMKLIKKMSYNRENELYNHNFVFIMLTKMLLRPVAIQIIVVVIELWYMKTGSDYRNIPGNDSCIILQDLQTYAGPNAVQEWRKLLVSIKYIVLWSLISFWNFKRYLNICKRMLANTDLIQKVTCTVPMHNFTHFVGCSTTIICSCNGPSSIINSRRLGCTFNCWY